MIRYLLDEQISPVVAKQISRKYPEVSVVSVFQWRDGTHAGDDDAALLQAAQEDGLALITYDQRTIPNLLREWQEAGRAHGGVLFVDQRTVLQNDFGSLIRALVLHWRQHGDLDWTNRTSFLTKGLID